MNARQNLPIILTLITLCLYSVTPGCDKDSGSGGGTIIEPMALNCEESWDLAKGSNGRLTQAINVTFRIPDEYVDSEFPENSAAGVRIALVTSPDVPVTESPKAFGLLDRSAVLSPGKEISYDTEFLDRICSSEVEICGEQYYIMVGIFSGPSYQDDPDWVYISEERYQLGGDECITIEDAKLVRNQP